MNNLLLERIQNEFVLVLLSALGPGSWASLLGPSPALENVVVDLCSSMCSNLKKTTILGFWRLRSSFKN